MIRHARSFRVNPQASLSGAVFAAARVTSCSQPSGSTTAYPQATCKLTRFRCHLGCILLKTAAIVDRTISGWTLEALTDFLGVLDSEHVQVLTIWTGGAFIDPATTVTCPWFVPALRRWALSGNGNATRDG